MRVESLITSEGKIRYMLVDYENRPVRVVMKFLRFKDNSGSARNTLRTYCYHLKLFFEFLNQEQLIYQNVGVDEMASFLRWLQNPYGNLQIRPISQVKVHREPKTVNAIKTAVMSFYDYLMRHEDYEIQLSAKLKRQISGSHRGFKDFLYHINKSKQYDSNILKLKVPKSKPKTLKKEEVTMIYDACCNTRDRFLILLLWESSMRIGEALSLWLEDFVIDARTIHIRDRGELINGAELKTACSPRKIDVSSDLMNLYLEYIADYHNDDVDTNHVFIKLSGLNANHPMEYHDVNSLFRRLCNKTKVTYATPHILRHTSLTELRRSGWREEHLMKRAGHAHVQTTMQMYIHPSDEEIRKDWEKAEDKMKLKYENERKFL